MRSLYIVLLALMVLGGAASAEFEQPRNYIAAMVNETIITMGQVDELADRAIQPLLRTFPSRGAFDQKVRELRLEILEQLVDNQLILDDFKTGGAKVPDAFVDDEIKDRMRREGRSRASLIHDLQQEGKSYEQYRKEVRDEMVLNFMRHKNVASAILISPQKIENYYATNLHQYQLGNQMKLRMTILRCSEAAPIGEVRKLAQEIALKLDEGALFAEMATIYSEGSERRDGGNLPWMEESKINKGFADIAAALKPGQHSGVLGFARGTNDVYWMYLYNKTGQISTARQYIDKPGTGKLLEEKKFDPPLKDSDAPVPPQEFRLMLVEDKRPARTETLAEVRDKIEKELINQERERLRKKWVERLRAKAFVRYY
jgi:parvulin-like peptidyl-prolyl isomerase